MTEMEKLFEKMLNMEMTNREMYEQCRNVAHEPMTNEEWLKSLDTEQLAEWMALRLNPGILLALRMKYHCTDINAVREWLKEKHD